jgi:hypothetical protein
VARATNAGSNNDPARNAEAARKRSVAIAARLRGLNWDAVAKAAGYADRASAYVAVSKAYKRERESMTQGLLELRQVEDDRDDDLRRRLYAIMTTPHYVHDGVNLVKGPDGEFLLDSKPIIAAITQLQRLGDRHALRHGLNEPEKLAIALDARTDLEANTVVDAILSAADAISLDPGARMAMLEAAQHRLAVIEGEVVSESED